MRMRIKVIQVVRIIFCIIADLKADIYFLAIKQPGLSFKYKHLPISLSNLTQRDFNLDLQYARTVMRSIISNSERKLDLV